jgi:ribonuclease D
MRDARYITTQSELEAAVFRMHGAARLALDTEFMRERSYFAQLCLIQIATDSDCVLVDPLGGLELSPLFELLAERSRLKVLHAARQDLEVLFQAGGSLPGPVFDTQVAAALLGFPPQVGYADLVARQLGHSIDKGQTRTDWSRRPLSPEQLAYAVDDVHHLLQLHTELAASLEKRGRASWVLADTAGLEDPALYRTEAGDAWRRLKGLPRLKPRQQQAARALAAWREKRAVASDKPRGWILPDAALMALAAAEPHGEDELAAVPGMPPGVARKRGEELLGLLREAWAEPAPQAEELPGRPSPEETRRVRRLMDVVRGEAERLEISPEILATRRDVEALARGAVETSVLLQGWRGEILREKLLAAMSAPDSSG